MAVGVLIGVALTLAAAARPVVHEESEYDTVLFSIPGLRHVSVSARQLRELNPTKSQLACDECVAAQRTAVQAELSAAAAAEDVIEALMNVNQASTATASAMKEETNAAHLASAEPERRTNTRMPPPRASTHPARSRCLSRSTTHST